MICTIFANKCAFNEERSNNEYYIIGINAK